MQVGLIVLSFSVFYTKNMFYLRHVGSNHLVSGAVTTRTRLLSLASDFRAYFIRGNW